MEGFPTTVKSQDHTSINFMSKASSLSDRQRYILVFVQSCSQCFSKYITIKTRLDGGYTYTNVSPKSGHVGVYSCPGNAIPDGISRRIGPDTNGLNTVRSVMRAQNFLLTLPLSKCQLNFYVIPSNNCQERTKKLHRPDSVILPENNNQ